MFETSEERIEIIKRLRIDTLQLLNIEDKKQFRIFYNPNTLRIKKDAFVKLRKIKEFTKVTIETDKFSIKDLLKISSLNNDLYFIDTKKSLIHTLDVEFANWCMLASGDKSALYNI